MTVRPHLLITNDDGINATGLHILTEALRSHADITVVAPASEQSGQSHAISVPPTPMKLTAIEEGVWSFSGTPADCVKLALHGLEIKRPIDFVFSGINRGQNVGINSWYSGTVAAAREAALWGIPSIALSMLFGPMANGVFYPDPLPFQTAGRIAIEILKIIQEHSFPKGTLLNINVPPYPYEDLLGWLVTRMSSAFYTDAFVSPKIYEPSHQAQKTPVHPALVNSSGEYINYVREWNPAQPAILTSDDNPVFDDMAVYHGYVSLTPMQTDMTTHAFIRPFQTYLEKSNHLSKKA